MERTKNVLKIVYCILALLFFRWIFSVSKLPDAIESIMSTIVYLLFFGFIIRYAIPLLKSKPKIQYQGRSTDHGSAQWASYPDFLRANNPDGGNLGLVLGVSGILRPKPGHLITVAGTGSGKGACLIIPSLLNQPSGSYVVTDPKGENAYITARSQKEYGQNVIILDPWDEQTKIGATHGIPAAGFNPFDFIKMDMDELRDSCEQIATFLAPDKPGDKDPFFTDKSRTLIKSILMHIVTFLPDEEHNFWTLYKMLRLNEREWIGLLLDMEANTEQDGLINIAAQEFLGLQNAGEMMATIRSVAQTATSIFESPQLKRSLEKTDFNPYDLTNGDTTVYIVIPERYLETHSTWLRMVIGLCLRACNAKPNKRVYYLLDEFAVMGKMKDVQKAFAFARGQNIVMWFFAQNLSQIKEIYGEDGMNTFIGNAAMLQCFGGMKDQFTQQYFSRAFGKTTAAKKVVTTGVNTGRDSSSSSVSSSIQTYEKDLVSPDEIETYRNGIFYIGEGLKFFHNKQPWFKHVFEGVPLNDPNITKADLKILKSGKMPHDPWYEYYKKQADEKRVFN